MKHSYQKPRILQQTFSPQECLCACSVQNKNFSEANRCGYYLEGLDYTVFAQSWVDCQQDGILYGYCYQPGQSNVFGS